MHAVFKQVQLGIYCTHHKHLGTQILQQSWQTRNEVQATCDFGLSPQCFFCPSKRLCLSLQTWILLPRCLLSLAWILVLSWILRASRGHSQPLLWARCLLAALLQAPPGSRVARLAHNTQNTSNKHPGVQLTLVKYCVYSSSLLTVMFSDS